MAPAEDGPIRLQPRGADVWIAESPSEGPIHAPPPGSISRDEEDTASRFYFERHRHAYRFAHTMLRDVLSRYVGRHPSEIEFRRNRYGKPYLATCDNEDVRFNMSHSGGVVVIGLALRRRIGIDVELIRPVRDLDAVTDDHFTAAERALMEGRSQPDQLRAFFTCWTRKEAYIKAIGTGLSMPLNTFDTSIPGDAPGRGVGACWLSDLTVPDGYAGAVAVESGFEHLRYWKWSFPPG